MTINETLSKLLAGIKFQEVPGEDGNVNVSGGVWLSAAGAYKTEGLEPDALAAMKTAAEVELRKKIAAFLYGGIVLELLKIHKGLNDAKDLKVTAEVWVSMSIQAILAEMGVSTGVQSEKQ